MDSTSTPEGYAEALQRLNSRQQARNLFTNIAHADVMRELRRTQPQQPAPTKAQEVAALRTFAKAQHPSSYLASWLKVLMPVVERDMKNDIEPADTPDTLREHAMDQAKRAAAALDEQIADKRKELKALDRQLEQNARFREEAIRQLRLALHHAEHA